MSSFFEELRRRNVFKVAVAYAIVGWLLAQLAEFATETFGAPEWVLQIFVVFLILGFPIALLLSWAYELTPQGMEQTKSVSASESITHVTGRKLDFVIIGLMTVGIVFLVVDNYVLDTAEPFAGADIDPASLDAILDDPPSTAAETTPATAEEEQREVLPNSVAVLPFENLSPDPDNAYFAAGIHGEILAQLQNLGNLSVISRTSVLRYEESDLSIPEIAAELKVETVMEGSVRYAADRVRIAAQLIDAATDEQLWSEIYERDFADVFAIQSDIAVNIANALEAEFSLEEQQSIEEQLTDSPEAYVLYLRAVARLQGQAGANRTQAMDDLERAIALDPEFARAYAIKARWYGGEDWENISRNAAERALALDPTLGLAHVALAGLHAVYGRWVEAQQAYERAYELSPTEPTVSESYARFKRNVGQYDEAIRLDQRAAELDPNNWWYRHLLGVSYRYARNFDAAALAHAKAIELDPAQLGPYVGLAQTEAARGNYPEAVRQLQIAEQLDAGSINWRLAQMALVYAQVGRRDDAMRLVNELEERENVSHSALALGSIALADYGQALQRFEDALNEQPIFDLIALSDIKSNYWSDPVLDEPRFREVRDRLFALD